MNPTSAATTTATTVATTQAAEAAPTTQPGTIVLWGPIVLLLLLAGAVHLVSAFVLLNKSCQRLIYFKPRKVPAVYLWATAEFAIPVLICWQVWNMPSDKSFSMTRAIAAVSIGLGTTAIVNGSTVLAGYSLDLRRFHEAIVNFVYVAIAYKETSRTALFWQTVAAELPKLQPSDLASGLQHIYQYIANDVALDTATKQSGLASITAALVKPVAEQIPLVQGLLSNVRRKDLAVALQQFHLPDGVIKGLLE